MNTGARLALFGLAVSAVFGGAMAVGAVAGPISVVGGEDHEARSAVTSKPTEIPRGLAVAAEGFRLSVESDVVPAETPSPFAFRILDEAGSPVADFEELHQRRLHLIVLSRNLVDYWHLHPTLTDRGKWIVDLPALAPGSYRVFADFQPVGAGNLTLGTDLIVPGLVRPVEVPQRSEIDTVDSYTVSLSGDPAVGEAELTFSVAIDGESVPTEPYLGAAGHLVAIRGGDLAFLHVHPHDGTSGDAVTFTGEFPTAGTYRLFFDFSHNGQVRTAAFTVEIADGGAAATPMSDTPGSEHGEGH